MDVLQRMGPRTAPATAVPPLELCALATTENAATLRRRFRCWVAEITDLDTADDLALAVYELIALRRPGDGPGRPDAPRPRDPEPPPPPGGQARSRPLPACLIEAARTDLAAGTAGQERVLEPV